MRGAATAVLARLAARARVSPPVMIVVAHPDDETLAMGAQLCRLDAALLVHVTDGAPRNGEDARRHGFASVADYAAARRQELAAALRAGDAAPIRSLCLGVADQEAVHQMAALARRVADLLRREAPQAVFSHAYEGGHPDHDACAFAVHAACRLAEGAPPIIEMPLYHRGSGCLITGQFLPGRPETTISLAGEDRRRKQAMIDCFATQRELLAQFGIECERFRRSARADFRRPPHRGRLHYETLGWGITGAAWRRAAARALAELGLAPHCGERGDTARERFAALAGNR